jgi:spore maturation protein CgeB
MKILIADVLLYGKPHSDWKEGYEFMYAFKNLGYECHIAGPYGDICETKIPEISKDYDLIIITDNYPNGWKWWDWKLISTPKLFWAIDTHLVNYLPWILNSKIDIVAFNNPIDIPKYNLKNSFWMPIAASKKHHMIKYSDKKIRDIVFIGGLTPERHYLCQKFGIEHLMTFGQDYIKEMQSSKICFNKSISYDINGKYFEILGSGSFMLTNYNEQFHKFMEYNEDIAKMFYYSEEDLAEKIKYYLNNDKEREEIAKKAFDYVYNNHTWENRAELIINNFKKIYEKNIC